MNQGTNDRKDRASGGDVTKAEEVATPVVPATKWDVLNHTGEGRFSPREKD
jgi:hypothetical protein